LPIRAPPLSFISSKVKITPKSATLKIELSKKRKLIKLEMKNYSPDIRLGWMLVGGAVVLGVAGALLAVWLRYFQ